MKRPGIRARWHLRRVAQVAAIGVVVAVTGTAAADGASSGRGATRASLAYACTSPSGPRQVSVQIVTRFPAAGAVGRPIRPAGTGMTVTLSRRAVADLTALRAATVTAAAGLTTEVSLNNGSAQAQQVMLGIPVTPVQPTASLPLSASGVTPPVTATAPGAVTFTAAGLALILTPHRADGTPTSPSAIRLQCTPAPGQDLTLATVPVAGAPASGPPAVTQDRGPAAQPAINYCKLSKVLPFNHFQGHPIPAPYPHRGATLIHNSGLPSWCAYVKGFSDVLKLKGAALLGPGFIALNPGLNQIYNYKADYFQQDSAGELLYKGLREFPPARATFLSFGFMPTTATIQISEIGTINLVTVGPLTACSGGHCQPTITTGYSRLQIHVHDVLVNGVPLNVGPRCQTAPFVSILAGSNASKPPYNLFEPALGVPSGGPLTGTINVPPFTGCGVGENLDRIFSASISGPGNFSLLTQGPTCQQASPPPPWIGCPPVIPKPLRHVRL